MLSELRVNEGGMMFWREALGAGVFEGKIISVLESIRSQKVVGGQLNDYREASISWCEMSRNVSERSTPEAIGVCGRVYAPITAGTSRPF